MRSEPLEPRRIRYPKGAYGWIDLRIVTEGHLQALDGGAALVYLFLCAVGNRDGISFWSRPRMARTLNLPLETIDGALRTLVAADLIAATERIVQVLPVPSHGESRSPPARPTTPVQTTATSFSPTPTPTLQIDLSEDEIRVHEGEARVHIARICGTHKPSTGVVRALAKSLALKGKANAENVHERPEGQRRP